MVSKVTVIALVAIVACPILLGYGFNIVTESVPTYKEDNQPVNVTPLLTTTSAYTLVQASPFDLNSSSGLQNPPGGGKLPIFFYEKQSTTVGSIRDQQIKYNAGQKPQDIGFYSGLDRFIEEIRLTILDGSVTCTITFTDSSPAVTLNNVVGIQSTGNGALTEFLLSDGSRPYYTNISYIQISISASYNGTAYMSFRLDPNYTQYYPNLTAGWRLIEPATPGNYYWIQNYMGAVSQALMSIDLGSSINDFTISGGGYFSYVFTYQSTHYTVQIKQGGTTIESFDLPIYNTDNSVYQFDITAKNFDAYYIGSWNYDYGRSNYYIDYKHDLSDYVSSSDPFMTYVGYSSINGISPISRYDSATLKGTTYLAIEDETYDPAIFKSNPSTTIKDIVVYGDSITFGGHTYIVKNQKITIESRQFDLKSLSFESVYNSETSSYDNMISGTLVSSTATPSSIVFNGRWGATVSTDSITVTTTQKSSWVSGQFGWNGLDQNFLIVGLLTSIGVFIALGIYMRRTKASLWPLLIVCGGAAMLFFVML